VSGCGVRSPEAPTTYRSCMVSRASAGLASRSSRGCWAMKGAARCASETRHTNNFNLTCTAKSLTRPTLAAAVAPVRRKESWHLRTALMEHQSYQLVKISIVALRETPPPRRVAP